MGAKKNPRHEKEGKKMTKPEGIRVNRTDEDMFCNQYAEGEWLPKGTPQTEGRWFSLSDLAARDKAIRNEALEEAADNVSDEMVEVFWKEYDSVEAGREGTELGLQSALRKAVEE